MKSSRLLVSLLALAVLAPAPRAFADTRMEKLDTRLQDAKATFQELTTSSDRGVPQELMEHARCIAVIPHTVKVAIGIGGRHGQGVFACRGDNGQWSAPAFVTLSGGSWGLQLGAESTDLVLFFMNDKSVRTLLAGDRVTLGGKASVAAGPLGRSAEASTDVKLNAAIYSYAKSKGLFAGISLEGARLAPDDKANRQYYGHSARTILMNRGNMSVAASADDFRHTLP